ncbi:MAG TPA: MMPL family transporter [Thermoleophilaceae bacterium]|nr:MMPL family transporter [Thermoleophilaceae bacterium]
MQTARPTRNIAARAARWSTQHRKTAIFGWLAFVIAAFAIGSFAIGNNTLTQQESGVGESGRADLAAYEAFPEKAAESVFIHSDEHDSDSPQFHAAVDDVRERLGATEGVEALTNPYTETGGEVVSPDGHSALVGYELPGDAIVTKESIDAPLAAIDAAARANPEFGIEAFGSASTEKQFKESLNADLHNAEFISLPLTLVILLFTFGTLMAAGIPVLLALTAVLGTMGLLGPLSALSPVSDSINSVVLLIGLAVGVDYALFYIRREREERAAGRSAEAALEAAAATSGRAVLISGFTVMTAMSGMYLAGAADFTSYATGTIVVVAMAMLGSLTVLPALLSKLGTRVDKGRVPLVGRIKAKVAAIGIWGRIVDRVLRRPLLSAVVSTALLLALAAPALGLKLADAGEESLPRDMEVVQTFDRVKEAFPSEGVGLTVVVEADDVTAAPVVAAIDRLGSETAKQKDLFEGELDVEVSPDKSVAIVSVPTAGNGTDGPSNDALDELRGEIVPATLGSTNGVEVNVSGGTAQTRDFVDSMKSHLPAVFAFVLGAAFLLLLITFRSIVIPIKAILLNLLSVGAAYGVLVIVFQGSWAEGLLDFESSGAIVPWLPLFMFVILFGLSMDYHVFILTRVKEAFDGGMSTDDAVSHAIKGTAGVVTSAAVVMVGVFSIFATLSLLDFKQMGIGLAAAVLIDATIIRGVLLPASMKLLGDWNWYLPKSLGWLPKVKAEKEVAPVTA